MEPQPVKPLDYASTPPPDAAYEVVSVRAQDCFLTALLYPLLLVPLTLVAVALGGLLYWLDPGPGSRVAGTATGLACVASVPVYYFVSGFRALAEVERFHATNRWQANVGLFIHGVYLCVLAIVSFVMIRGALV